MDQPVIVYTILALYFLSIPVLLLAILSTLRRIEKGQSKRDR